MTKKNDELYQSYVHDLGCLIKEYALEAKAITKTKTKENGAFEEGLLFAYFRITSLMQDQAKEFGIPLDKIGLNGLDAYKDLVNPEFLDSL